MPGGLFARLKDWVSTEDVTAVDLNAEFDNIINNLVPGQFDDYELNVPQMQMQTDPGELGTEILATTLAGEIERIRFILHEITGKTYWYQSPSSSISDIAAAVGGGITPNRLSSGRTVATSLQPAFLIADGTAKSVRVDGNPIPFVYYVEGVAYTISTDVVFSGLASPPATNNTALVNDANFSGQVWTKYLGEEGTEIPIDTVGSEISNLAGKLAAFKIVNGGNTEYFIAEVGTNKLLKAKRGYFFDSADAPFPRIALADNNVITLMKLSWIYARSDGTLTVSYTNPVYAHDEPLSPSVNDYWFDLANNKWKTFSISSFVDADATLIGVCFQDAISTLGARSFEFFINYGATNSLELLLLSSTQVKTRYPGSQINVWGSNFKLDQGSLTWDITTDLEFGVSESPSTLYYLYVTETGDVQISDIKPYDRREDLNGFFHPYNSWRFVGTAYNNGSSNLTVVNSLVSRYGGIPITPAISSTQYLDASERILALDSTAAAFSLYLPSAASTGCSETIRMRIVADGNPITLYPMAGSGDTIEGETSQQIQTKGTVVELQSNGISDWAVV